jgi:hypothetical protein
MGDSTGAAFSEGVYLQNGSTLVDIVNNSVHVMNNNATSAAVTLGAGTGGVNSVRLMNNNLVNSGAGKALVVISNYNLIASDYNNFYVDSGNVLVSYTGTNHNTLGAYSSATGWDANSLAVDPMFSGDDLHTCRVELDNAAMPYTGLTWDFDGDTRNTGTPDIGADEFLTSQNFSIGPDTLKCPADTILLGGEVINSDSYYWSPFFQTTPTIEATTAGLYIVQVVSACGTAVDSMVVTTYPLPVANFSTITSFYTVVTTNNSVNGVSYSWDFGDGSPVSTDAEPSHVYTVNGQYTITLTVVSACGDTATYTQVVNINPQFAGIDEEGLNDVNVYPNPSEGYFNVSLQSATGEDIRITVQDLSGRMVFESVYGSSEGEFTTPVDVRGVAAGTYILRLQTGKYSSVTRIIVR